MRAQNASTTAGMKFAAAVPEVHTSTTGSRSVFARPSPKNAAERSSRCIQSLAAGWRAIVSASGVEREPGHTQKWRTPERTSSSTNVPTEVDRACWWGLLTLVNMPDPYLTGFTQSAFFAFGRAVLSFVGVRFSARSAENRTQRMGSTMLPQAE